MDRRRTRRAPRLVAAGVSGDVLTVGNLVLTAQPAAAAVTASFNAGAGGLLSVFADSLDNTVTVSRNDAGAILVTAGPSARPVVSPRWPTWGLIQVFGLGGNDTLTLSETSGALPRANLFGGNGNDSLTAGSGDDQIFGQGGQRHAAGPWRCGLPVRRHRERHPDRWGRRRPGVRAARRGDGQQRTGREPEVAGPKRRTADGGTEIDLGRKRLVVRGVPLDALQRAIG